MIIIMFRMKTGFRQNDEAISPVLGAVLIMAIAVTIITNIQLNFVPIWNAQEELDHLKKMSDDFKELKSSIGSALQSGTTLSVPLSMGFKYSPKIIGYNPKESAYASLSMQNNIWAEVRYNEVFQEGMTDETSIKNVSSSTITYALHGAQNYNSFIYEHGLIRRSGSNYTASSQTLMVNNTLNLVSLRALDFDTISGADKKTVNIYPTSPEKSSVVGKNVWLILHTKPEYVNWWGSSITSEGGVVKNKNTTTGNVIAYINSTVLRMGETYISTAPGTSPSRSNPFRLVKVTPQNINLPVDGITSLTVEVQDYYNNPVPNVPVSFIVNSSSSRQPANAFSTATLLQSSAISGSDGRANVQLKTGGAGIYYIDASIPSSSTTFAYPASSQGGFISLTYVGSDPTYTVTATFLDGIGVIVKNTNVYFDTSDGTVTPSTVNTGGNGNATTTLDITGATGIRITNIQIPGVTSSSANITWDTNNTIVVTANGGYVFNAMDVPNQVSSNGCVNYGTSPGNYPNISCDILASSHSVTLTGLQSDTAYYFIINSSRPGGESINSTEYMFVTGPTPDTTPPASVTGLTNASYTPMYIRWTWTDPADSDFKEVQVYIDGVFNGTVAKGVQSFNASYFRPNSMHTISTRTVDTLDNVNATWNNHTASTSSVFTYVFDFLNITGTVSNFGNAQNDSDGGATALFAESLTAGSSERHNYTNVTGYTSANGSITNFANMQTAADGGAFATMTEGLAIITKSNRTKNPGKTTTTGTQFGTYTSSNLDNTDAAIDITLPAVTGTTTSKGYLMNTVKTGAGGTLYWNINTTNGAASDINTIVTLGGTANRNYVFRPGQNNNKVTGTPGAAPAGYGWVSSTPVNGITSAGTWSFQVRTVSSINTRNGQILVYVYKYNVTGGTDTFLFSATGTANHLGTTAGTTELITSAVQPEYVFNSDEYLKVEYWLNAVTTTNGATLRFETNTATQYVQYSKNMYSLNTTYTFTETNSSSTWQSISIQDSSYGDALGNASIFNVTSGRWESILAGAFTGGSTPTTNVNAIKGASGNASSYNSSGGQIKLMYNWTNASFNNSLGIDMINVTVVYTINNYLLNITTNITSVPADTNYYLEMNYSRNTNDTYNVYVYNGSVWNNRGSLTSLTWNPFNVTIDTSELINGNVNVRYIDSTPAGSNQGKLFIDYLRIHGYTPAIPPSYTLNITTNTTNIPDASVQMLQLRYSVSANNFTLQLWNGSSWNNRTTLNDTALSYRNITLLPEEFIPAGSLTGGAGTVTTGYVLVRYLDLNASAAQQGKLYLDYQRVYSS